MEADRVMQWLNGKELRSVVFVSLAMMAHGLELSGAALRARGWWWNGGRAQWRLCVIVFVVIAVAAANMTPKLTGSLSPPSSTGCLPFPPRLADRLSPLSRRCGRPPLSLSPSKAHNLPILFSPF
ncbi:hypothetical protein OsJ_24376 [Oryza sativa Japonica Group]|uniref:Uncharacterized protein n=1 Tax=Oryza sativa subsp. japonica TaxID=39947 RepID=B9FXE7_ORYSJ|nr:hypothetical protein OsJ_24376 [Oryza sativa Japonica Group]